MRIGTSRVIALDINTSLPLHRSALAQSALLKGALEQHSDDVFLVFLRAVKITDRLRGTPLQFRRLLKDSLVASSMHFPFSILGFWHPFRCRSRAADGDLCIVNATFHLR